MSLLSPFLTAYFFRNTEKKWNRTCMKCAGFFYTNVKCPNQEFY
ncbi:hypothetical protein T4C_10838 [Trichinella pseudospiralis]|uniref:Uncharacterized protein n=1 Tax=Trichinella pseudospiralis TaxID=6337 RepID=A0A0V1H7D6_TRIPS|nr:hypothetical protein T4C_10838 [Trichinella pseudospiralis]